MGFDVTLELGHHLTVKSRVQVGELKQLIQEKLFAFLGFDVQYTVQSLRLGGDWRVWCKLKVNTTELDYP